MSTVEVKAATNNRASGPSPVVLYTVPVGKQAVVRTVNITNTNQTGVTISPVLGLRRSGSITRLSSTSITNLASANMLTAPITMIAGDELVTTEVAADTFGEVVTAIFPDGSSSAAVAIVDSNTIICCNTTGIYRSTDAGVTFTQVSSLSCSVAIRAAKIGTDYFIYQSVSSAYRSTDSGVTWTTQAVTNAPDNSVGTRIAAPGKIVYNGTVYGGLTSATQLSTTTDGITWTNVAAAFPEVVDCLVWSGTHWIGGRSAAAPTIYRSTDGTSWSTVTARTSNPADNVGGLATDGAGVIITGNPSGSGTAFGRSADHGVTWADQASPVTLSSVTAGPPVIYIGSNFYIFTQTTLVATYSPTALTGSFVSPGALTLGTTQYGVNGTNVFYTLVGLRKSTLTIPTAFAGMDVTAAILEVTP